MHLPTKADIAEARKNLEGVIVRTPLVPFFGEAPSSKHQIYLKLENTQRFGSFKVRAATNAIKSLPAGVLKQGVVTASAGNFGQGLCAAANLLDVKCTVIVPDTAARTKIDAMRKLGAIIVEVPYAEWWHTLETRNTPMEGQFIHPVCEQTVMAGNATIGAEILEDLPDADIITVPVGGGGLACGIGSAVKGAGSDARLIAAESETSMPVAGTLANGSPIEVEHTISFIDGMGGKIVLDAVWPLLKQIISGAVSSTHHQVADAIRQMMIHHSVVAEGAGAASLAAALHHMPDHLSAGKKVVCVISGGNIDNSVLQTIMSGQTPP
ncbi:pyridoxal-phosphate dependent enzyme [Kordiimonas aquimaris]|uniref:pyridoxal-phosphate dependent enzyme n=1 Tax=Kordiimonas aquimaris TaxID=707591 RepID=UPI0021CEBB16|nr:pyridoxal-phosphate dependent enzyme [Kordiimonas aquimaris]